MINDRQGQEWLLNKLLKEGYTSIDYNPFQSEFIAVGESNAVITKRAYIGNIQLNILGINIPHDEEESYLTFSTVDLLKANRGNHE